MTDKVFAFATILDTNLGIGHIPIQFKDKFMSELENKFRYIQ
jgi:hypothetical protein